jgi:hypothetical protein
MFLKNYRASFTTRLLDSSTDLASYSSEKLDEWQVHPGTRRAHLLRSYADRLAKGNSVTWNNLLLRKAMLGVRGKVSLAI